MEEAIEGLLSGSAVGQNKRYGSDVGGETVHSQTTNPNHTL